MEAFQKIHPLEFYRKFLQRSVRPDGRSLNDIRKTSISTGAITTACGSSFVKIGNTSVICGIRSEVGIPSFENTDQQTNIFVNLELGPICSNIYSSTKPSEQAMSLSSKLNSLVKRLDIPKEDFYFDQEGKVLWYLYVDIYCLDYDGNIMDASILALISSLKNVKLPRGIIENTNEYYKDTEQLRSLQINHYLFPLSFSIIEDFILSDPSNQEEQLSTSNLTITLNENFEICLLSYSGIKPISETILQESFEKLKNRIEYLKSLIDSAQEH
ncbi:hypothetical protein DLAC_06377 [Tieghemostelium lacteum]|uniref:Ribosomal RNA-processing protein 43 n=1 Tax=Tieghemostelium lacteum TaxID=361077 RepID=A0A151ZEL5_TIELA|nr:hypothetical protein DLAC_06377 [Tieghemostelium lacteum]|eukprot:KYQ92402.1 hypothetical protein DLAC_06377 [Tieghemostelium lacteum]